MATYVNDLRLKEISTGDESGTWGTSTNTNLELIGEALGYATQQVFGSDADATTTIADGASDPARAMYFKITSAGSLTATRTCTIAPNTVSRVMFIENATSGSQSIAISQGSGASVTILTGKTAVVYLDGAGATAAVVDAMSGVDPGVTDTLTEVLVAGNTSGGTNIELSTTDKVQFRDAAIYLNSSVDGQLDIVADTEIQIAATTVDLNGNLDVSGTALVTGVLTTTAATVHTNGITMPDNAKAIFGAGSDLEIYHDGSNSYIKDQGTGNLNIQTNGVGVVIADTSASDLAVFNAGNGQVSLYNSGSLKLATTATGIDVTGSVTATGTSVFVGANTLTLRNDTGTDADEPKLTFDNDTFAGANYGNIRTGNGGLQLILESPSTSTFQNRQRILFNSGGSDELSFDLSTDNGSSFTNYFKLDGGNAIFNETGADKDFRVESSGNENMLFVDGGGNAVGIGTATPTGTLHVDKDIASGANYGIIQNDGAANTNTIAGWVIRDGSTIMSGIRRRRDGGTSPTEIGNFSSDEAVFFLQNNESCLQLNGDGSIVFNEDALDKDFRVESDTNANGLMLDASTSTVGVNRAAAAGVGLSVNATATNSSTYAFEACNATSNTKFIVRSDGYSGFYKSSSAGGFIHNTDGAITITPDAGGHFVFNEDGVDADFRVESDTNANMLVVDGGADLVVISGGSKVTDEVLRVNGAQVVGSDAAGVYTVGLNEIFAASAAKYLRIQQDGSLFGGLTITATGDYSNVNAIGCFQKIYSIGANNSNTTLFSPGNVTVADLGETSGQFSMGTPTKPNATTIYIPLENLNASYILDMSITVEFRGRIGGISAVDILDQ
jgi:hypothetical protein